MTSLADAVLPLIRTRRDLDGWGACVDHGRQMHEAIDVLERSRDQVPADEFWTVTNKALASAIRVIARADDSAGYIGGACDRLLDLHPYAAAAAGTSPTRLVEWMWKLQLDKEVDYFTLDVVAYSPALGDAGLARYRARLAELRSSLVEKPAGPGYQRDPQGHLRFIVEHNERRLAVHDRDVEAIIRTHSRDLRAAAWLEDTARALAEINEVDLAVDWARRATEFDTGHQAEKAGGYWCDLLHEHHPDHELDARLEVFRRWPNHTNASRLFRASGPAWPTVQEEVFLVLEPRPRDAVMFALDPLKDLDLAWRLAHEHGLEDNRTWADLAGKYAKVEPLAVLPIYALLVEAELVNAGAGYYRTAARWLAQMRKLAAGTDKAAEVDDMIRDLREEHRRRPRLQFEFDKAGLPS